MASSETQQRLIERLRRGDRFAPPVSTVELIETHISCVLLAGAFAYKIKKPVNFGFVDFSTLERRRHFCEEELRLNRRLAPELYLRVAVIAGTPEAPVFDGPGAPIEYALVMRRFDEAHRADRLLAAGGLTAAHIERFARELADFHACAEIVSPQACPDQPERAQHWVTENLDQIAPFVAGTPHEADVAALRACTERESARLLPVFRGRLPEGRVRDGHGDLHLANLVLWEDRIRAYDCLEFNAELRRIDVASEMAFLFMDFEAHERSDFAWLFLNAYLESCGDYAVCELLRYCAVYRALVRVKVECLSAAARGRAGFPDAALRYLALAERYSAVPHQPPLILMHGLSGSGKSRVALDLLSTFGAIRLRSDVERRRLADREGVSTGGIEEGAYRPEMTGRVYAHLRDTARMLLQSGIPVIVDATFLKHAQRAPFLELAGALQVPALIVHCEAPEATLRERIIARAGSDASQATVEVLEHQMRTIEPFDATERARVVIVDTTAGDGAQVVTLIRRQLGG